MKVFSLKILHDTCLWGRTHSYLSVDTISLFHVVKYDSAMLLNLVMDMCIHNLGKRLVTMTMSYRTPDLFYCIFFKKKEFVVSLINIYDQSDHPYIQNTAQRLNPVWSPVTLSREMCHSDNSREHKQQFVEGSSKPSTVSWSDDQSDASEMLGKEMSVYFIFKNSGSKLIFKPTHMFEEG